MRKKQAMHLDARYVTMVENAYYYCNPPPVEKTVRKKRPPLQEYIRKLLYKDLSKVTTEKVLKPQPNIGILFLQRSVQGQYQEGTETTT